MKVGTKSLLFGVHQFLWHPYTVARAQKYLTGEWPKGWEWLAVFVHDWGYWGCDNMDGPQGKLHPLVGAKIVIRVMRFFGADPFRALELGDLVRYHSQSYAARDGHEPSALCWPDKCSIKFDPCWFYLFRARLSGEIREYYCNSIVAGHILKGETLKSWYYWLRNHNFQKALRWHRITS